MSVVDLSAASARSHAPGRRRGRSRCGRAAGTRRARPARDGWSGCRRAGRGRGRTGRGRRRAAASPMVGGRGAACEVVATEAREAQVGLAAKHDVDVRPRSAGKHGGQRTAGHQQAPGRLGAHHLGDGEGVAGEADHRGDADDVGPLGAQVARAAASSELNVQSKTLVSTPSRRSWPASVATPSGGNSSSVAAWCGRRERPTLLWAYRPPRYFRAYHRFIPTTPTPVWRRCTLMGQQDSCGGWCCQRICERAPV